jgi:hypothetical protein
MLVVGGYLAARAHRFARTPEERTVALAVPAVLSIYLAHCYGDMGLGTWTAIFIVAPTLSLAAKVAVSTGAWPTSMTRRAHVEAARGAWTGPSVRPHEAEAGLVRVRLW